MVHLITYDLKVPNDKPHDYERVIGHIKTAYPTWAHIEQSVWLVSTFQTSTQIRDKVKEALNSTDALLVAQLADWATWNTKPDVVKWLNSNL